MGQSALRAVTLCDPAVIKTLNSRYVPFVVDMPQVRDWSWREAFDPAASATRPEEAEAVLTELHTFFLDSIVVRHTEMASRHSSADLGFVPAVQILVRTLDGRLRGGPFVMGTAPDEKLRGFIDANCLDVKAGRATAKYESRPNSRMASDDIALRVVARYGAKVTADDLRRIDNYAHTNDLYFMPAFQRPARDWVILPRARWSRLLPAPAAAEGTRYNIDREVAAAIALHLLTEDSPPGYRLQDSLVRRARLFGTVCERTPSRVLVMLDGTAAVVNPGFVEIGNGLPRSMAHFKLRGFLEIDPRKGTIRELQLVTVDAAQVPPQGEKIPFDAVAYLVRPH